MDLRDKLIKLAYTKPDLRKHLLPLLKQASTVDAFLKAVEDQEGLGVGDSDGWYDIGALGDSGFLDFDERFYQVTYSFQKNQPVFAVKLKGHPEVEKLLKQHNIPVLEGVKSMRDVVLVDTLSDLVESKAGLHNYNETWGLALQPKGDLYKYKWDRMGIVTEGPKLGIYNADSGDEFETKFTWSKSDVSGFLKGLRDVASQTPELLPFAGKGEKILEEEFGSFAKEKSRDRSRIQFLDPDIKRTTVEVAGRWHPNILPKEDWDQTPESRRQAQREGEKLIEDAVSGMNSVLRTDYLKDTKYQQGDKNYFYLTFKFKSLPKPRSASTVLYEALKKKLT